MILTELKRALCRRKEATLSELIAETQLDTETVTLGLDFWRRRGNVIVRRIHAGMDLPNENAESPPVECQSPRCSGCTLSSVCGGLDSPDTSRQIVLYCWQSSRESPHV